MPGCMGFLCGGIVIEKKINGPASAKHGCLRELYGVFFKNFRILPNQLAVQCPHLLLGMLDSMTACDEPDYENMSPHLKLFYGK